VGSATAENTLVVLTQIAHYRKKEGAKEKLPFPLPRDLL
jgi:hypothetical protein